MGKCKNYGIIVRISNDLQINRYEQETESQYISRVIYSAISVWARVATLDEDIFEEPIQKIGVSKKHILNKCKTFMDNMIELYPEIYEWFHPEGSEENPVVTIRERLNRGGELVDVGFNTDLALPPYKICTVNKRIGIIRGLNNDKFHSSTGLGQFIFLQEDNSLDIEKAFEFYCIKKQTAQEVVCEYIKNIKWYKKEEISAEIFNKYSVSSFSNCWDNEYTLANNDISLYKQNFSDFGFIKKNKDTYYISQISQYLIDRFEVRRFMYGLKSAVDNFVVAKYKRYDNKKLVELNLYNDLPEKEQNILLLLGWPKNNINDRLNLLFHTAVWEFIEEILNNLNISLQEVH